MTYSPGLVENELGEQQYDLNNGTLQVGRAGGEHQTPFTEDDETGERRYLIEETDLMQDQDYREDPDETYLQAVIETYPQIHDALAWAKTELSPQFIKDFNEAMNDGEPDDFMPFVEQLMEEYSEATAVEVQLPDQQQINEAIDKLTSTEPGGTEQAMEWMQLAVEAQESDPILSEAAHLTAQVHRGELPSSQAIQMMVEKYPMIELQRIYTQLTDK